MRIKWHPDWPVLRTFDQDHLLRLALPLGGIGTGTVSLGGRGDLRDWEIMNRPAKGFVPRSTDRLDIAPAPAFVLYAKRAGEEPVMRLLEGPLDPVEYEGSHGAKRPNSGMPRFAKADFAAAYPLGQLRLGDPEVPLAVRLDAFNPLIPGDAERSGLPTAILRFTLQNLTDQKVTAAICGSIPNFIGIDGSRTKAVFGGDKPCGAIDNRNHYREGSGVRGIFMDSAGVDRQDPAWGTMALATTSTRGLSYRTAWAGRAWGDSLLDFWDDFSEDGRLTDRQQGSEAAPMGSIAVRLSVPPHESRDVTFLIAWHFPNRRTWTPAEHDPSSCCPGGACEDPNIIGNYYTTRFADAWIAAEQVAATLPELEADTLRFLQAFCGSDLPDEVKEAALANLTGLRSQTTFRTPDGRLYGFEGCFDDGGCCLGSCTHVWNYEQATAFLFGELACTMREVEFNQATREDGAMSFRVHLPVDRAAEFAYSAADGQLGCLMKLYREWQHSGDDAMLRALWPNARRALEFCWIPGGWDADQDGVMEGCQHNTMDVEYFGPNPQMQGWYLGALQAMEAMAHYLGDDAFARTCRDLYEHGSQWMDDNLFNGDYYEHEIRPPASEDEIAPGLRVSMGCKDVTKPVYQLGSGCLIDQLVGQYMAHVCGLGYLHNRQYVRQTLRSIMAYNWLRSCSGHFNHLRSFVLGDEAALLMASYPHGQRPDRPFPYYNEVMTGFEYTAAVQMIYEGQEKRGLKVIRAIRDRYDGRKRNPFNEAECGHHYARAMASWAAVVAVPRFHYSAVTRQLTFKAEKGTWFWSNGYAWGTCRILPGKKSTRIRLTVLGGTLPLAEFKLAGKGRHSFATVREITAIETINFKV